MTVIPEMRRAQ